jgi:peptidoglycan/LPS O-acetylase OafA/YrhL
MSSQFRTTLARLDRAVDKFALPLLTRFSVPTSEVESVAENSVARSTKKLHALTSLRFVAAMLIVVHHSRGKFGLPQNLWQPFVLDQGVSFFFVLSGFILTYVYPSLSIIGKRRFLLARVARIWPAHATVFILLIVLAPSSVWNTINTNSLGTMLANLLLVHAWIPLKDYYFSFNSPSWSISTELGFYLCFLLLIHNWRRTWHLKLVLTFLITCSMITIANVFHLPDDTLAKGGPTNLGFVYIHPLARLFEFTVGMTTALAWRYLVLKVKGRTLIGTVLELAALGLTVFTMYYSISWMRNLQIYPLIDSAGALWLVHGGLTWLSFALLILVMALEWGMISQLFSFWLFVLLGEISFSVYLIHQILLRYYAANSIAFATIPGWFVYIVFWIVTLLMAHLTWSAVERPCRAFLVRLWPKRSKTQTMADHARSPRTEALRSEARHNPLLAALVAASMVNPRRSVVKISFLARDDRGAYDC